MKLHIPAPEQEEGLGAIDYSLVLVTIAAIAIYMGLRPEDAPQSVVSAEDAAVVEKLSDAAQSQKDVASKLDALKSSELRSRAWTDEEIVAALRFGARATNETACGVRSEQIAGGTVSDTMRLELLKAVDRRDENAPYACLSLLYFADKLPQEDLQKEVHEFWEQNRAWEGNARLVSNAIESFKEWRERPESPEFWKWARVCALNMDYEGAAACQSLLFQVAPTQGEDLVMVADKHFSELGAEIRPSEAALLARGLGWLTRNGQPKNFRIVDTAELPDYDHDLRDGALFQLCRLVNSPDPVVSEQAAKELSSLANYGYRAMGETQRKRWYEACRKAFKATDEVPVIAVWSGSLEDAPRYDLARPYEAGYCQKKDGYPLWYCGAERWESKDMGADLYSLYAQTSWIEWEE